MSIDATIILTFEKPVAPTELVSHLVNFGWTFNVYGSVDVISPEGFEKADWASIGLVSLEDYSRMVERFSANSLDFVLLLARSDDMVGGSWHFMDGYRRVIFSPTVHTLRSSKNVRVVDSTEYLSTFANLFSEYPIRLCELEARQAI